MGRAGAQAGLQRLRREYRANVLRVCARWEWYRGSMLASMKLTQMNFTGSALLFFFF